MSYKTYHPLLTLSIEAAADLPEGVFVGHNGNIATTGGGALGLCVLDAAKGEMAGVGVIGVYLSTAGGEIAAGDLIAVGDDGKAVKATAGAIPVGVARDAATADGDTIGVILGASTAAAIAAATPPVSEGS